jgi:hypothetical protein
LALSRVTLNVTGDRNGRPQQDNDAEKQNNEEDTHDWGQRKNNKDQPNLSHASFNPSQISVAPARDRKHDKLGKFIAMQGFKCLCKGGDPGFRGLDHKQIFIAFLHLPVPTVNGMNAANNIHAGSKPGFDEGSCNAFAIASVTDRGKSNSDLGVSAACICVRQNFLLDSWGSDLGLKCETASREFLQSPALPSYDS